MCRLGIESEQTSETPSAAPDFLFCVIRRRRWPLAELPGHRRRLAGAAAS
jgi:hypothetical protein